MIFLLAVVVPQFAVLYDQMGSKLPAMTMELLAFGKWLHHNFLWLVLMVAAIAAAVYRFSITDRGRDFMDGFRIGLPVFGKIWLKYQVALFSRTLSTLLTGRIAAGSVAGNGGPRPSRRAGFQRRFTPRSCTVREGKSLADSLAKHRRISRPGVGDDHGGRADGRPAADAELGCRIF